MIMELVHKYKYSIADLLKLVGMLRFSNGFRARCHESIRSNLIQESYDVLEAIDSENSAMLKEELGDILLQIMYHCDIEDENKRFCFDDVVDEACKKLVSKYPHVFRRRNLKNKQEEKCKVYNITEHGMHKNYREKLNIDCESEANNVGNISKALPALVRTSKTQERAAKLGYGLFSVEDALNETFERLHYLETLILDGRQDYYEKEIGNLIFSVVEIARLVGIDAENALYNSCEKFKNEFLFKISLENTDKV